MEESEQSPEEIRDELKDKIAKMKAKIFFLKFSKDTNVYDNAILALNSVAFYLDIMDLRQADVEMVKAVDILKEYRDRMKAEKEDRDKGQGI